VLRLTTDVSAPAVSAHSSPNRRKNQIREPHFARITPKNMGFPCLFDSVDTVTAQTYRSV
jgi:hypothetical protein